MWNIINVKALKYYIWILRSWALLCLKGIKSWKLRAKCSGWGYWIALFHLNTFKIHCPAQSLLIRCRILCCSSTKVNLWSKHSVLSMSHFLQLLNIPQYFLVYFSYPWKVLKSTFVGDPLTLFSLYFEYLYPHCFFLFWFLLWNTFAQHFFFLELLILLSIFWILHGKREYGTNFIRKGALKFFKLLRHSKIEL